MDLKERILASRINAQLTQEELAKAVGKTRAAVAQWESGLVHPRPNTMEAIAKALNVSLDWLLTGIKADDNQLSPQETNYPNEINSPIVHLPSRQSMPLDVPVMGTAACNAETGAFKLDSSVIDYVRRPPGLITTKDVYALYVEGDSMEPKFISGDLIFIHPRKPVRIGDPVVVQIVKGESEPFEAMIAVLVKRTGQQILLQKYNPKQIISFDNKVIVSVHKILAMNELFGI